MSEELSAKLNPAQNSKGLIYLLVAINLSSLGFIWYQQFTMHRPRHPAHSPKNTASFLVKELTLSPSQSEKFQELRKSHFNEVHYLKEESRILRHKIVTETFKGADTAVLKPMGDRIGAIESEVETLRYKHFQDLLSVCDAKQKVKFQNLMSELNKMVGPPPDHRHRGAVPVGPPRGPPR